MSHNYSCVRIYNFVLILLKTFVCLYWGFLINLGISCKYCLFSKFVIFLKVGLWLKFSDLFLYFLLNMSCHTFTTISYTEYCEKITRCYFGFEPLHLSVCGTIAKRDQLRSVSMIFFATRLKIRLVRLLWNNYAVKHHNNINYPDSMHFFAKIMKVRRKKLTLGFEMWYMYYKYYNCYFLVLTMIKDITTKSLKY